MLIRGAFFLGGETGALWAEVFWYSFSCYFFLLAQVFMTILWGFSCRIQSGLKMMMRETKEIVQAVVGMVVISLYLFRFGELEKKVNSFHFGTA